MNLVRWATLVSLVSFFNLHSVSSAPLELEVEFLPGDLGYSASASLLVEDLNMDNVITADAGFYNIYGGPSEVAEASIDFFVNNVPVASYDNADNFVLTYPFFIFGYDIPANSIENIDLGADPGIYAFYVPSFGTNPLGQFVNTDTGESGIFGGIEVTVIPEPGAALFLLLTTGCVLMLRSHHRDTD